LDPRAVNGLPVTAYWLPEIGVQEFQSPGGSLDPCSLGPYSSGKRSSVSCKLLPGLHCQLSFRKYSVLYTIAFTWVLPGDILLGTGIRTSPTLDTADIVNFNTLVPRVNSTRTIIGTGFIFALLTEFLVNN